MTERSGRARELGASIAEGLGRVAARLRESTREPADLLESDDEFLLVVDAPGATAEDVEIRYDEGTVRVRVDRYREPREGFELRYPGRGLAVDAAVDLPPDAAVDPEGARAVLADEGVLRVALPKVSETGTDEAVGEDATAAEAAETAETPEADAGADEPDGTDVAVNAADGADGSAGGDATDDA